ncbi:Hypothetical protein D9617_26g079080 [Elsinoe fawcettii]|nr:Hypothetical protein D9617_26g079080 [Elsinoe fawcettii]
MELGDSNDDPALSENDGNRQLTIPPASFSPINNATQDTYNRDVDLSVDSHATFAEPTLEDGTRGTQRQIETANLTLEAVAGLSWNRIRGNRSSLQHEGGAKNCGDAEA